MDFNSRMSQQFRSQGQGHGGRAKAQQQQQQQSQGDAMLLVRSKPKSVENAVLINPQPEAEIAGCISDIGVQFSIQDLKNPNPQQIQKVFEWFAELLMNATREIVEPAMKAAAEDACGEYMEAVPADTRNLMGFYVSLRKLLQEAVLSRQPSVVLRS